MLHLFRTVGSHNRDCGCLRESLELTRRKYPSRHTFPVFCTSAVRGAARSPASTQTMNVRRSMTDHLFDDGSFDDTTPPSQAKSTSPSDTRTRSASNIALRTKKRR